MCLVSVIVPARDSAGTLPRVLDCLRAQETGFDFEVLVVDDGSRDATPGLAQAAGAPFRLIGSEPRRPGAAVARNRGAGQAKGSLLAFCDSDCYPTPGWLAAGARALESAEIVQGMVLPEPRVAIGPFDRSLWITGEAGLWETANLFVTRELFDRVGGFQECLAAPGGRPIGEDVWFGWRAKRLGARSAFIADALTHHAVFAQRPREYVAERSRRRHFPELVKLMPELRDAFLYRGLFLDARSAAVDGALLAAVAALALRRPWLLSAALPYGWMAAGRARAHGRAAPGVAAVDLAADLTGAWALLRGSVGARTVVL